MAEMNEEEQRQQRVKQRHAEQEEENRRTLQKMRRRGLIEGFGLVEDEFYGYRLGDFEVVAGTEEAFGLACRYLMVTEDLKEPHEIYEKEGDIDAWYDQQPSSHHFLTFVGPCGRGKTHLALGIGIWYIERRDQAAVYYQVPALLNQLRNSFEGGSELSHGEIMTKCENTELLILDDLGMQATTKWALEQLDSLIDSRYVHKRDTVFTTNLTPDELPPRIASRIKEGEVAHVNGSDYREALSRSRLAEVGNKRNTEAIKESFAGVRG